VILPTGPLRVYVATRPVDFRKGMDGLAALAQEQLRLDPFSGAVLVFRAKRTDRVKILVWDGTGTVLIAKRLDGGNFAPPRASCARSLRESDRSSPDDRWPSVKDGVMRLSAAQLAALFEGLDWRRVHARRVRRPEVAG
jgi:transposase